MSKAKTVLIIGEEGIANEWKKVCEAKGFQVVTEVAAGNDLFLALELTLQNSAEKKTNIQNISSHWQNIPILTNCITVSAGEQRTWLNDDAQLLGIAALRSFLQRELLELTSPQNIRKETWDVVQLFIAGMGKEYSVVQDRVGMVLPRIICMLVNEAFFALQEEIASPQAIDTAMKLGTNYPMGPIEWGEHIGYDNVVTVLAALHKELGDDRYRTSPLLKQVAFEKRK